MTKSYTLPLSRWHKVAERLSRHYAELTQGILKTLTNTEIGGYLGESQITRLKNSAEQELLKLHTAFAVQDAIILIRQAIGGANTKNGVSNLLAEYDALTRRQKLFESILSGQSNEMISFDELPQQIITDNPFSLRSSLRVRMLDASTEAELQKQAEELRAKVYALADQISDLNGNQVTLELPESVAQAAGL